MSQSKKVVVFDFDGVILPSDELKETLAWEEVGSHDDVDREILIANVRAKVGNRFGIIQKTGEQQGLSGEALEKFSDLHAKRYGEAVDQGYQSMVPLEGTVERVRELAERAVLYINSRNPEGMLEPILERLGILDCFKAVYTGKTREDKRLNLERIAREEGVDPDQMVMIGDGADDLEAATAFECSFIAIARPLNGWDKREDLKTVVSAVSEITDTHLGI